MRRALLHLFGFAAMFAAIGHARAADPKLATRIYGDSTIFTLNVDSKQVHKVGTTFEVTMHVHPGTGWHVYSADMSSEGGLLPLKIAIPSEISKYFELVTYREEGPVVVAYDSAFDVSTRAHDRPYDIIVKVSVLAAAPAAVPFYLYVNYQTCNESTCQPPRWYQVPMTMLGGKPLEVMLATNGEGDNEQESLGRLLLPQDNQHSVEIWHKKISTGGPIWVPKGVSLAGK